MGLESGTYISDLNTSNPAGGDQLSQADDHLRLIKSVIKNTFPNIAGEVSASTAELNYVAGVTSSIQDQLDVKAGLSLSNTMTVRNVFLTDIDVRGDASLSDVFVAGKVRQGVWRRNVETKTIADDGTHIFNALEAVSSGSAPLFKLLVNASVARQAMFWSGAAGQGTVAIGSSVTLGGSTNPNVDTLVNIWIDANGFINIKNRDGDTRSFTLIQEIAT